MVTKKKPIPFDPDWVMAPGSVLKEEMEINNLSPRIMARICGIDEAYFQGILDGKKPITPPIARGLASIGVSAQFWLNFERIYREGIAKGKKVVG